jgi:hypothetical protein
LALTAYGKAWKRIERNGLDPPSEILGGLLRQLDGFSQREPELIPHPTTWLNRDGWEDQPDAPKQAKPHERLGQPSNNRAAGRGVWASVIAGHAAESSGEPT